MTKVGSVDPLRLKRKETRWSSTARAMVGESQDVFEW